MTQDFSFHRSWLCLFLLGVFLLPSYSFSQDFYDLIESCNRHTGQVKSITTKQKADFLDYQSPTIKRIDEYDQAQRIIKSEIYSDRRKAKTISYHYIDDLLIYEQHKQPEEDDYLLVYQYLQKKYPRKILKVTPDRKIINYARLEYSEDFIPVYMSFYNLLGDLLEKRTLEYYGKNHMVIEYFYPELDFKQFQKYELLCKFNQPDQLNKRDFKDVITRPINIQKEDNTLRIIKAVEGEDRERIEIEEVSYDENGNWITKKTYELKKKKTKKKLIGEIEREIVYY